MSDLKDYKLEWIHVRNLAVVWPEAQRVLNEKRAKKIADNFDPDLFDPPKVTLPNGNGVYHVCDGQKRVRAAEQALGPDQKIPCMVANAEGPARAAEIFLETNSKANRQDTTALDNFKVAITAQWSAEVNIDRIVRHCGYYVDKSHAQNTISAVRALDYVYKKGGKTLDRTLRVLRDTWGGDPAGVSSQLIKGYGTFIREFEDVISWDRLRECVKKSNMNTPGELHHQAQVDAKRKHIDQTTAMSALLLDLYNRGLPAAKKLKRKDGTR